MKPKYLFQECVDLLIYVQAYGPAFPEKHGTNLKREFRKLNDSVKLASDYVKTDDAKRFISFCLEELQKALASYEADDRKQAIKHMDSARHWFEEARKDTPSRPTFIVGPDGKTQKV